MLRNADAEPAESSESCSFKLHILSTEQDPHTVAKQAKDLGAKLVHVAGCLDLCLFLSWSKHFVIKPCGLLPSGITPLECF